MNSAGRVSNNGDAAPSPRFGGPPRRGHRGSIVQNMSWLSHGCVALAAALGAQIIVASPIRPLAQEHVVVGESPFPGEVPLYSPTILRLNSGRLVAGYTRASGNEAKFGRSLITFHRVRN